MTARTLGPYELLELLGEGGVGQVYAARDTRLGRQVAIKTLRPEFSRDRNFLNRFLNEARRLGELSHPNITTLYDLQLEAQEPYMVMELVRGQTLETVLSRVGRLSPRQAISVVAQAIAALTYAHSRGVIHRDIKPSNLMIAEGGLLKIMDFGIARVRGSQRMTRAGQMFGTLLYASPEQIKGNDVDERSDLYSLAVVVYEMLAGVPPFTAENDHALMTAHLDEPPPPLVGRIPQVDTRIDAVLRRALAKQSEARFASVDEFGQALGVAELRGESSEILQALAASTRARVTPAETRYVAAASAGSGEPQTHNRRGRVKRPMSLDRQGVSGGFAERRRLAGPIAILAAAVVALAGGFGYVILKPAPEKVADVDPNSAIGGRIALPRYVAPAPAEVGRRPVKPPSAQAQTDSRKTPRQQPDGLENATGTGPAGGPGDALPAAPNLVQGAPALLLPPPGALSNFEKPAESGRADGKAGGDEVSPSAETAKGQSGGSAPEPQPPRLASPVSAANPAAGAAAGVSGSKMAALPPLPDTPAERPPQPASPQSPAASEPPPKLAALPPVSERPAAPPAPGGPVVTEPSAQPKPDLTGTVQSIGGASRFKVLGQWIELYGIDDPASGGQHNQAVFQYLKPFAGRIQCYAKGDRRFQCFAGGQDLAVIAIRRGFVRLTVDAPADYRALVRRSRSARR